ncbi:MAG: type II toxin-antitoxin system VapC family toxin [Bacteroidota bacterium]
MRLLLDTNALIYLVGEPDVMRAAARDAVRDPANAVFFSAVNVWEIEIKVKRGKLSRPAPDVIAAAARQGYAELAISARHGEASGRLPLHHRDPFDRVLIAQAQVEGLTLVTRDRAFAPYDVPVLPC